MRSLRSVAHFGGGVPLAAPDGGGRLAGCGGRSPRRLPLPRRPAAASTRLRPVRVCTLPVALRCPG